MYFCRRRGLVVFLSAVLLVGLFQASGFGQQVVQRGALGRPSQVMDETQQWTTPLLVSSDHDVEIYIPDVTSTEWLKRNYADFMNTGQYVVSMFTFYRTTKACRANQIGWGNGDYAHLDACNDISYRLRQGRVDTNQKTVTLMMAGMIGQDGQIEPESVQDQPITRTWADLDANTKAALKKTTDLISAQMAVYDRKMKGVH
jgi:hypothetical protein